MLSGMQAAPGGARRILLLEQEGRRSKRLSLWPRVIIPAFAVVLIAVTAILYQSAGLFRAPVSTPAVESIAAGDSADEKHPPARADLPVGSVNLSGSGKVSFRNLFSGNSMTSFPMICVNGAYYRMLNEPQNLSGQFLGKSLGKVSLHTSSQEADASGIISNIVLEGENVYRIQSMDGAAVSARVNGETRVFQRVSMGGKGLPDSLSEILGTASVQEISLSGVGRVTDAGTIRRLMQILTKRSTFLSGSCSATSQALYITCQNGVTLQLYVTGSTMMSCGSWSCGEFMEEFRQVAK